MECYVWHYTLFDFYTYVLKKFRYVWKSLICIKTTDHTIYSIIWLYIYYKMVSTLCYKVCQWFATGRWFSPGTPVSATNTTDSHEIIEILLKVALNIINQPTIKMVWTLLGCFNNTLFYLCIILDHPLLINTS